MEIIRGNVKVEWVRLGEGYWGDFDPTNPADKELLRFDVFVKRDGEWEEAGSRCTLLPVDSSREEQMAGLEHIMMHVYDAVLGNDLPSWVLDNESYIGGPIK